MVDMKQFRGIYNNYNTLIVKPDSHFCKAILEWFGLRFLISSAMSGAIGMDKNGESGCKCNEFILDEFFRNKKIDHLLEVGTYLGVMALLFTRYAKQVTTIDAWPRTDPLSLWGMFEAKVNYFASGKQDELDSLISKTDFDFAYIDADHSYNCVKHDFENVKKCGRVLFHDYWDSNSEVEKFVKELPQDELTFIEPFVYWERK